MVFQLIKHQGLQVFIDIKESLHLITAKVNMQCYTEESVTAVPRTANVGVAREKNER